MTKPSPGTHGPEPRYSLMAMLGLLIILLAVVFGAYRVREQLPEIVARTPASAATQPEQDASAVRTPDWTGPRYFQGHPGARDETIQVLKPAEVATQVKRVAAARGVPVELVRELVAEQAQGHQSGNGAIDVHTLNLALDRRWPAK